MTKNHAVSMKDAVDKIIEDGTPETVLKILNKLARKNTASKKLIQDFNAQQMDEVLEQNHINDTCPYCGSKMTVNNNPNIVRNGKYKNGMQRYHCKACNKNFNRLTNTFLAQTTFSFEYWVTLVWLELNLLSLQNMKKNLISDDLVSFVSSPTIWSQRMKLMAATHDLQPTLSGVVEIDECHLREAQKGELELINYFSPAEKRKARYSYEPSRYGVKGAEFVTIVCAVDNSKHYYAFVSGLGSLKKDVFEQYVVPHIADALWLCSDANVIYTDYSKKIGLPHYVKPSTYTARYKECKTDRDKDLYYKMQWLDYILNYNNRLTYKQMIKVRDDNHLSIAHVNEFHKDIKYNAEDTKNGINLEYVQYYMDWMTYLKNFANTLGEVPTTKEHARTILIDLLDKSSYSTTIKELKDRSGIQMPKPGKRFTSTLIAKTDEIRAISGNSNYVMTPEDIGDTFSVRKQLEILNLYILKTMGKDLKIPGYTGAKKGHTWKLRKALEVHPDIKEELNKMCALYPSKFNNKNEVK